MRRRIAAGKMDAGRSWSRRGDVEACAALMAAAGGRGLLCGMAAFGTQRTFMRSHRRQHLAARQQGRAQPHNQPNEHKPSPPALRRARGHQAEITLRRTTGLCNTHRGRNIPRLRRPVLIHINRRMSAFCVLSTTDPAASDFPGVLFSDHLTDISAIITASKCPGRRQAARAPRSYGRLAREHCSGVHPEPGGGTRAPRSDEARHGVSR